MSLGLLIRARQTITLDILMVFLVVTAGTIFLYLSTYVDVDLALSVKGIIGFSLLLFGLLGSFMFVGFKTDQLFSLGDLSKLLTWGIVAVAGVTMVNMGANLASSMSVLPVSSSLFVVLMAIAEETFFRGFLLTMFQRMTANTVISVGASSIIGTIYHTAVYGTSPTLMLIVLAGFTVIGISYVLSGYRLSIPVFAHAMINFLSTMG